MSELETAQLVEGEFETSQPEAGQAEESAAESAPAQTEAQAEVKDETQELRKTIAEKAFKEREARRRADDLEKRLKELEAQNKPEFDGAVPSMPDPFDDDFEQKIRAREEALQKKAKAEAFSIQQKEIDAEAQRKREREEFEQTQKLQSDFRKNAATLGVDNDSLTQSAQTVINYGVTPEIENAILSDKEGPLMLQYLAANPMDLADLIEAAPLRAGMLLAEVKNKSLSLKRKPSSAPPPPASIEGRGVTKRDRGPKGATFE
jgi:hypothetical protein